MKEDWIECTLQEAFETVTGNTPPKKEKENYGDEIPFIKPPQIENNTITTSLEYLSLKGKEKARILPINSVLVTCIGNLGRVGLNKKEVAFNQQINAIKPVSGIEAKFTFYQAQSINFRNQLEKLSTSTTVSLVNKTSFNSIRFKIAALAIQKAIVKKIEALFSDLDQGVADLKKAQEQLKIYRQAVLKKAFEGIKDLKPLKDCGDWKGGGTPSKQVKEYWEDGNIPWVSSRDVKTKEIVDTERHITEIAISNSSTKWIEKNSILFVMRSGILRRIFPIAIAKTKLCVNQDIQTVSLNQNWIPEYVYWFLLGNESDIRNSCSKDGTTVESIDSNSLKEYLVPFCQIEEQHQIVKEIESRLSVCDAVEQNISESLEKAQALRQSILKKAFERNLLSEEEIAQCKAQPDYEPASVLLEKIKKEKKKK
ncbi:restriction endonuclease subunit S [Flavobacteriaceae bacterium 14752]|uniref:restriction endonuclease subunit S n=1 Tax=Mesohalobacter salilacus TaxID=2491711 RepID=UPI000F63B259|nr:hypothetical protein EIG84_12295 [Flavobacteriaceae bacterium 14752]